MTDNRKNIYFRKKSQTYVFSICRFGKTFTYSAETLDDALEIKKSVLEFIKSNNRVPTSLEGSEMFDSKYRKVSRKSHKDQVINMSTGELHISADRTEDTFIVQICRDGRTFSIRVKNLEHAKILRDEVINYYQTHGVLPKSSDFIDRRNELDKKYYLSKDLSDPRAHKETYISKRSGQKPWFIRFIRKGRTFTAHAEDLQSAIEIRDKALAYYEKHRVIPKRSQVGAGTDVELIKVTATVKCLSCKRQYRLSRRGRSLDRFRSNNDICTQCQLFDYASNGGDVTNIYQRSQSQSFTVAIYRGDRIVWFTESSLKDALKVRDQILNFERENNRMPNKEELASITGRKLRTSDKTRRNARLDRSKISDRKYISESYHSVKSDKVFYNVMFTRNKRRFAASAASFEDALKLRNTALDLYDETGQIPSLNEVKERMKHD